VIRLPLPLLIGCALVSSLVDAQELHPQMTSKYWVGIGAYFAARDHEASADGTIIGGVNQILLFDQELGLDDGPSVFMAEFGWQFSKNWAVALQYFDSEQNASKTLEQTVEWKDVTYNAGVAIQAGMNITVTRLFFSRRFWDGGRHSFRAGAGIHWLDIGADIAGQASLNDMSTEFRVEPVSANAPVPNIGAWYRYSPSDRWIVSARVDWLSANIDVYSGEIWNFSAGANFRITQRIGVGVAYQYFELDGSFKDSSWTGDIHTRFSGPFVYVSAAW
jgi:uncharacterized protein YfiM (DUF2279 family)